MGETEQLNLKNPFAGFNASLMDDGDIIKYWIQPHILFGRQAVGIDLTGDIPVILMGGRGTGKTMLLKYMSNEIRIKDFVFEKKTGELFLDNLEYLGIYHRFDGPRLSNFNKRRLNLERWEMIFKHYFELIIGQKYIIMLLNLKNNGCIDIDKITEIKLVSELLTCINVTEKINEENKYLDFLVTYFQKKIDNIFKFINGSPISEDISFRDNLITFSKIIFTFPLLFSKFITRLKDKRIIILLDEYENLQLYQQKIINTLIKHTKLPVTFRVSSRFNGFKTYDTLNENEFLMEDADYRLIKFEDILMASRLEYKNLLIKIAEKRLNQIDEFKKRSLLNIKNILSILKPEDEAIIIVHNTLLTEKEIHDYDKTTYIEKAKHIQEIIKNLNIYEVNNPEECIYNLLYPQNPLIEMLNLLLLRREYKLDKLLNYFNSYKNNMKNTSEYGKYKALYDKNKLGLLFQLVSLYRPKQKVYAGFNVYSMLSSGIIRNFLELCYQTYNIALFSNYENLIENKKIDIFTQTQGAETRSEKYFEFIDRIPTYGTEIKSLVRSLGTIFYSWQNDPVLSEPEVTYFAIDTTSLSERGRNVIDSAVQWSVLQSKKPMKGKSPTDPLLDVFALNHILAPYFGISYRLRGRINRFTKKDIEALMFEEDEEKEKIIKKLGKRLIPENTTTIYDFIKRH